MYRTAKHELLMSESLENKSVYDLPGIGAARGGRLESAGIRTASELASFHKSMGHDDFRSFLNQICGQNDRWTGMTIAALDEYSQNQTIADLDEYSHRQTKVLFTLPQELNIMTDASEDNSTVSISSNEMQKTVEGQLNDLSASIELLLSCTEQCKKNNEKLSQEISSNVQQVEKFSVIVNQLLSRFEQHAEACRALDEKITASDLKIVELNRIVHLQAGELNSNAETIKEINEKNVALENDKFKANEILQLN